MNIKFLIHGNSLNSGAMTLVMNSIAAIGGTVLTRLEGTKRNTKSFIRKQEQISNALGVPVEIATTDEELREMISDIDILFLTPFGNKEWSTFDSALRGTKCKKVVYVLGTADRKRAPAFTTSNLWDAWWSERPMIRDYFRNKGIVKTTTPYIVGCNVYDLKCQLTPEEATALKDPKHLIQNARFGSFKGSHLVLQVFDELIKNPSNNIKSWGWTPNEAGMYFFTKIKSNPELLAIWNDTGHKVAAGTYSPWKVPEIMKTARFALDATRDKNDGTIWGDGGLQYCQAEAIDYGCVPMCDSNFHVGEQWNDLMVLFDRNDIGGTAKLVQDQIDNWNPEKHAKMIEAGRKYIVENLNRERFNASIKQVVDSL